MGPRLRPRTIQLSVVDAANAWLQSPVNSKTLLLSYSAFFSISRGDHLPGFSSVGGCGYLALTSTVIARGLGPGDEDGKLIALLALRRRNKGEYR